MNVHTLLTFLLLVVGPFELTNSESTGVYFTIEPADTTVAVGGSGIFNCAARGDGLVKTTWKKDGSVMEFNLEPGRTLLSNGSLLITPALRPRGVLIEGTYQCLATIEGIGSILSRSAKLITTAAVARFTEEPEDITVGRRQTARFSCSVDGTTLPQVTNWFKNNGPLVIDRTRMNVLPSGSLEIRQINESDEGLYNCNLPDIPSLPGSRRGRLVLSENPPKNIPPVFTTTPKNQVVSVPDSVLFECSAVSYPIPTISWLKDGVTLDIAKAGSRFSKIGEGNLMISPVEENDKGTYQCRAENPEDSVDISATLDVHSSPRVHNPRTPISMYGFEKSDVELPCVIHGSPLPRIQWYKNGDRIIEGDYFQMNGDNLLILGLVSSDGGMYQCVGVNLAGNAQSSIYLQVLKPGQSIPISTGMVNSTVDAYSPSQLTPLLTATRFVTLAWKPPNRTNGQIISYTIYYKEVGSERERVLNITNPVVEEINVQGLQPNKTYTFRVVPHGEFGVGKSSEEVNVLTQGEMNVPGPPKFLKAAPASSTSIFIRWDPPEGSDHELITGYKVYYSEAKSEYHGESELESGEHINGGVSEGQTHTILVSTDFTILNNLNIFTEYYVWVVAVNLNGPGLTSDQVKVRTLSDVPSSPPTNVTLEPASTVIVARWEPPPLATRNGLITGYKVKYKQRGKKAATLTTDGNSRFIGLSELERGTEYQVKIAALSVNGTGPFTEWVNAATAERELDESSVPDKPNNIQARASAESITITWTPPPNSRVVVRGYTIGWGKGIPDVYSKLVDGKSRFFTIEDLKANSDYVISLRAYNQVGDGIPIYENVRTRPRDEEDHIPAVIQFPPPVGLRAVVLSPTSVVLYWTDTNLRNVGNERRLYVIRYAPADQQLKAAVYKYTNTTEQNVIINDLRPGVNYEFSVKVIRGRRSSEWSLVVFNRTGTSILTTTAEPARFAPPKDLTLLAITGPDEVSTVVLSWQPPKTNPGGEVKGYLLFYTTNPTLKEWVEETVGEDVLTHRVSGLTPDTTYYFRMSARYSKAFSISTPTKSVATPLSKQQHGSGGNGNGHGRGMEINNTADKAPSQSLLYALIGVSILVAIVSVFCCTYYRTRRPEDSPKRKKSSTKLEIKPPDLWIHHDQMGFKNIEKNQTESLLLQQAKEFDPDVEKIPLQYNKMNSLDRSGTLGGKSCDTFPSSKSAAAAAAAAAAQYRMTEFSTPTQQGTLSRRGSNLKSFNVQEPGSDMASSPGQFMQTHAPVPVRSPHSTTSTSTVPSPIHRLSSTLGRREPIAPIAYASSDQCCSNEDLSQEISNLEGLMKDLTAITASEFQC